ncbi:translation initiation factor IF-5A [Candidatus Pacearchaeota archaeon]|nr:translation initiation factor IF-5A [Candidatus Pacearchaeota archaeon]
MAHKLVNAVGAKSGTAILVDGIPCIVRGNDISKTGKHGHAKCRIEAISILDGKKKVFVTGGHERLEVPMIKKSKAQILSIENEKASVMDLDTFENFEVPIPEELKEDLNPENHIEYWESEGHKIVKRKI